MVAHPELLHEGKEFREVASRMQASLHFGNTKDLEWLALKSIKMERSDMLVLEPVSGWSWGKLCLVLWKQLWQGILWNSSSAVQWPPLCPGSEWSTDFGEGKFRRPVWTTWNPASEPNPWGLQNGRGMLGTSLRNEGLRFGGIPCILLNAHTASVTSREYGMPCGKLREWITSA